MKQTLCTFFSVLLFGLIQSFAQTSTLATPAGSDSYGKSITVLTNGNYVVADPTWRSPSNNLRVGAVYLYNGKTHELISTLTGEYTNDRVGAGGVVALNNGHYVVLSPYRNNSSGAATWGNGTTGISGIVGSWNSLVGTNTFDQVGSKGCIALSNGNYLVVSPSWKNGSSANSGAVTWGSGTTGISGIVDPANSLVGSTSGDLVGYDGIAMLSNGNYVVASNTWDNGTATDAGAVTWGDGSSGTSGVVSAANSLVGSTTSDRIGHNPGGTGTLGVIPLSNGHYVIRSPNWDNGSISDAGAVTWGNGTTGASGAVSSSNSLVGSTSGDGVGRSLIALTNGHYVVSSSNWDNGVVANVGAVTWGDGSTGISGAVSSSNSLVGSSAGDGVGSEAVALTNGNYVIRSPAWKNGDITTAGAVTWRRGDVATSGHVSTANSLVGSTADDLVGLGVVALSNGNYVVSSELWDNGDISAAGAVTWGNGTTGTVGIVGMHNSLVGSKYLDQVGRFDGAAGVIALSNGHYVVRSSLWDNGDVENVGAVTWGNGITGTSGIVNSSNSLTGSTAHDKIGNGVSRLFALKNGNYLVTTPNWGAGVAFPDGQGYGAVTWGNGSGGTTGAVSSINSLVGSKSDDRLGASGVNGESVAILNNGDYVVSFPGWDNGALNDVGAVTWGNGITGTAGHISTANSLVGSISGEMVGSRGVTALSDGNYVAKSPDWSNSKGALTLLGYGASALMGPINTCNSVIGGQYQGVHWSVFTKNEAHGYVIVGFPTENKVVIYNRQNTSLAVSNTNTAATISGSGRVPFIDSGCQLLLSLSVEGAAMGNTLAKVWIDDTQNTGYVKRHYEITPATNTTTSTGKVTLYFTQSDFDDFNHTNAIKLPVGENDAPGKANLLIEKRPGSSTGNGAPGTYSGTPLNIDPADEDIVWNSVLSRWEVSFHITGFSGFFIKTSPSPLPVTLIRFSAQKQENTVALNWQTTEETNSDYFEIQRSSDAKRWTGIGEIKAKGESKVIASYAYDDPLSAIGNLPTANGRQLTAIYYRLKMVDQDATFAYSRIAVVEMDGLFEIKVFPNPASKEISFTGSTPISGYKIINSAGQTISEKLMTEMTSGKIALPLLPAGLYHLELYEKGGYKHLHKVVIAP